MKIKFDFSGICEFELFSSEEKKIMSMKKNNSRCKYLAKLIEEKISNGVIKITYDDLYVINPETIRSTDVDEHSWPLIEWEDPDNSK